MTTLDAAALPSSATSAGAMLRSWRRLRRYSQLALALRADVSARHLSYVETGRAKPSREMLLRLAETLEMPHRERNALLIAGGFAPEYGETRLGDPLLREVREAVDLLLTSLEPCPALAVDRRWTLVAHNRAAGALLAGLAPEVAEAPLNVLRASLHPRGLAPRIVNLAQWRAHVLERLRRDVELSGDPVLAELLEELRGYPAPEDKRRSNDGVSDGKGRMPVLVPLRLRTDAGVLSFVSTTTVFGTAVDVTVAELAVESFLPADAATAVALRRMSAG
ncbi:MAG TPA: helix-turn-helix transcriptional regulator [Longimicrobium sp.]|nr:helix-turn-helix transcriptional regulator [Longimicrobium sp.]